MSTIIHIRESLLYSVELVLSDLEDVNSHYNDLTFDSMADAVTLCKQIIRLKAHGHPLCSEEPLGQSYKMVSKVRDKEDSESDDWMGSATK